MKEQELLEQISKKLSALTALAFVKEPEKMTAEQGVKLLIRFGLSNQEMADILGTTKGTIEVLKSRVGKSKK
jgi:DNA-binding CsgD family transcriptional regulator